MCCWEHRANVHCSKMDDGAPSQSPSQSPYQAWLYFLNLECSRLLPGSRLPRSQHYLEWLSSIGRSNDMAVIMRLPCRTLTPRASTQHAKLLSTKEWKEHVKNNSGDLSGDFQEDISLFDVFLNFTCFLNLLLTDFNECHVTPSLDGTVVAQIRQSRKLLTGLWRRRKMSGNVEYNTHSQAQTPC